NKEVLFGPSPDEQMAAEAAEAAARERKRRRARRARHRRRLEMKNDLSRRAGPMMVAMTPVEYAGGERTEVALDLDRGNLHIYHTARGEGRRDNHRVVPLSKVSASVAKRNPKLVVLRWSGRHLATIGQGAWREISGQDAAHRKRLKAASRTSSTAWNTRSIASETLLLPSSSAAAAGAGVTSAGWLNPGPGDDVDTNFATEAFSVRARSGNRSSRPSRVPSSARRYFRQALPAVAIGSGGDRGTISAQGNNSYSSSVACDVSLEPRSMRAPRGRPSMAATEGARTGAGDGVVAVPDKGVRVLSSQGCDSSDTLLRPTPPAHARDSSPSWRFTTCPPEERGANGAPTIGIAWSRASPLWTTRTVSACRTDGAATTQGGEEDDWVPPCANQDDEQDGDREGGEEEGGGGEGEEGGGEGGGGEGGGGRAMESIAAALKQTQLTEGDDGKRRDGKPTFVAALSSAFAKRVVTGAKASAVAAEARAQQEGIDRDGNEDECGDHHIAAQDGAAPSQGNGHGHPAPFNAEVGIFPRRWTLENKIRAKSITTPGAPQGDIGNGSVASKGKIAMAGVTRKPSKRWRMVKAETNAVKAYRRAQVAASTGVARRKAGKKRWGGLKVAKSTTSYLMHALMVGSDEIDDDESSCSEGEERGVGRPGSGNRPRRGRREVGDAAGGSASENSSSIWCESSSSDSYSSSDREGDSHSDGYASMYMQHDSSKSNSRSASSASTSTSTSTSTTSSSSSSSTSTSSNSSEDNDAPPLKLSSSKRIPTRNALSRSRTAELGKLFFAGSIVIAGLQEPLQKQLADQFVRDIPNVEVRIVADVASTIQTVQIMPPSLVLVAWAAFSSAKLARDFLGDGARGLRGIKPGLPVAVVGGENDGEGLRMSLEAMGATAVLLWPYKPEDVTGMLETCLNVRR
ncbi:unnamed protein product, partial [Ectocarpus sp. 12 AP-2014]